MDSEFNDNIDKLIAAYPIVFKNVDKTTYSDLPDGWYELVDKLCADISELLEAELKNNPDSSEEPLFSVLQIKEKFGGLRFYFMMNTKNDTLHKQVQNLVDVAEDASYSMCQETGKPGVLCKKNSHYQTYCEDIRNERGYRIIGN